MNSFLLFSELLSAAIWNRPVNASLFKNIDGNGWKNIYKHITTQGVSALIADSIQTLPLEYQPPKPLLYPLLLSIEKTENLNLKLRENLVEITSIYKGRNIDSILLKGQGNSLVYPKPLHRPPGDLDLFLYRPEYYTRAKEWLKEENISHGKESTQHIDFDWKQTHIENHHSLINLPQKTYNKILNEYIQEIVDNHLYESIFINGMKIKRLPAMFNTVYVFLHLFKHFIDVGIGIRHLCDWILLLNYYKKDIDKKEFMDLVNKLDLLKPMQNFAAVSMVLLNAPKDIFPLDVPEKTHFTDKIIQDIKDGGNFGYHHAEITTKDTRKDRARRYLFAMQRSVKFGMMSTQYFYPQLIQRINNRIYLKKTIEWNDS